MIEKAKDVFIIILAACSAILLYLYDRKKSKLANLYYEKKSYSYKKEAKKLYDKHQGAIDEANKDYDNYKSLLAKYRKNRGKFSKLS